PPGFHLALGRHPADDRLPRALEHAVLVRRGRHHRAVDVVLGPRAGLAIRRELPGHRWLAVAELGVRAFGLAVLVGRLHRQLPVDVLLGHAFDPAALVARLERELPGLGVLLPRAVAPIAGHVAIDDELSALRELLVRAVGRALVDVLLARDLSVAVERQ